ncbi:MAG TPA: SAM-dependent methyltransferase [Candidatus Angelobacter sp.]|nr:SAM-dependent methyltransferase [Candidatus Angelobacter sp.]
MPTPRSNLIIVAYPSDETLGFSSVCRNAAIIVTGDPKWPESDLRQELQRAAVELKATKAMYLGHAVDKVDSQAFQDLVKKLRRYKVNGRVYTHSPFDEDTLRGTVALAAAQAFDEVWVQANSGIARQVNVLKQPPFAAKARIINSVYASRIRSEDDSFRMPHTALLGVEAFTPATFEEVMHGIALTRSEILPFADAWGLFSSPYEVRRYERSCKLLQQHAAPGSVKTILEVGACEGSMTVHLRRAFPEARVRAVEVHPEFARRLRARFRKDKQIEVVEKGIEEVPLHADVVLLAEVLYYVENDLTEILRKVQARYLMTSSEGDFDLELARKLTALQWRLVAQETVGSCFEAVSGGYENLFCRREGTTLRVWQPASNAKS